MPFKMVIRTVFKIVKILKTHTHAYSSVLDTAKLINKPCYLKCHLKLTGTGTKGIKSNQTQNTKEPRRLSV